MDLRIGTLFRVGSSSLSLTHMSEIRTLRDAVVDIDESIGQLQQAIHIASVRQFSRPYTAFLAKLTGYTGPFTSAGGSTFWRYEWEEAAWNESTLDYIIVSGGRKSNSFDRAINIYEITMPNNGGNTTNSGAILTRLRIPLGSVVNIHVIPTGHCWFDRINPLDTDCE
jgi:hypothetical protein